MCEVQRYTRKVLSRGPSSLPGGRGLWVTFGGSKRERCLMVIGMAEEQQRGPGIILRRTVTAMFWVHFVLGWEEDRVGYLRVFWDIMEMCLHGPF